MTSLANVSLHTTMSWWRWTAPLGNPVEPDEYSQNAGSSRDVGAASRRGDAFATRSSNER